MVFILSSTGLLILLVVLLLVLYRRNSVFPMDHPEFQDFAGSLDMAFMIMSADMKRILYASPSFERIFSSYNPDLAGVSWMHGVHPDDFEILEDTVHDATRHKRHFEVEFRIVGDGPDRWIHLKGFPVFTGKRRLFRFALSAEDISVRKSDELKLVQARDYEVTVGARIQQALLLGKPNRKYKAFDLASMTLPSQKIDGDFIDFFDNSDEILDLMVGDVMGKGIPAALMGAAARNAFVRARMELADETGKAELAISGIVTAAEQIIAEKMLELKTFLTLVYGRIDGSRNLFRYVDCGHTSIIHFDKASGQCWRMKGANMPIGFTLSQQYLDYTVPLSSGDILFLYSDGITEAANMEGELFGEDRLMKVIRTSSGLEASLLLEKIKQITFFYSAGDFRDDVTGISIRIMSETPELELSSRDFPQSMSSLRGVREFFSTCLEDVHSSFVNHEELDSMILALGEAAANIFKHDNPTSEATCTASFRRSRDWIAFYIYYHGKEYDWQFARTPSVEKYQTRGYGLYLINEIMDSVTVSFGEDDRVRLCMLLECRQGERK